MSELCTVEDAANHWGVSLSRARSLLSERGIKRIAGYDADQIRAVQKRQGARTDLDDSRIDHEKELPRTG